MSSVSQIITFRKGRAFTTRKPSPPAEPAPAPAPAVPSAKVTIGSSGALGGVTYAARVQKKPPVEIDTRPPTPSTEPPELQAAAPEPTPAPRPAAAPRPTAAPEPDAG